MSSEPCKPPRRRSKPHANAKRLVVKRARNAPAIRYARRLWNRPVASPLMLRLRGLGMRCRNSASYYTSTTLKSERPRDGWGSSIPSSRDCMHHLEIRRLLRKLWKSFATSCAGSITSALSCDEEGRKAQVALANSGRVHSPGRPLLDAQQIKARACPRSANGPLEKNHATVPPWSASSRRAQGPSTSRRRARHSPTLAASVALNTHSVWLMTLQGTTEIAAAFPSGCGVGRAYWAWIKSVLPLAASLPSGLRKTAVKIGDAGHAYSACLASRFGSMRPGRLSNGEFSLCADFTPTHGQEAFGPTGLAPMSRSGNVCAGQRRAGRNSAKPPDDTWPGTRRRDNCPLTPGIAHRSATTAANTFNAGR